MATVTADVIKFLRNRLDEDDRAARVVKSGPWAQTKPEGIVLWFDPDGHVGRHSPARVQARTQAIRELLAVWEATRYDAERPHPLTVRLPYLLAAEYADHPEYREEWKP